MKKTTKKVAPKIVPKIDPNLAAGVVGRLIEALEGGSFILLTKRDVLHCDRVKILSKIECLGMLELAKGME